MGRLGQKILVFQGSYKSCGGGHPKYKIMAGEYDYSHEFPWVYISGHHRGGGDTGITKTQCKGEMGIQKIYNNRTDPAVNKRVENNVSVSEEKLGLKIMESEIR